MIMQWDNISRYNVFNPFYFFCEQTQEERKYLTFVKDRRDKKLIKICIFDIDWMILPVSCRGMKDASFDLGFWRNERKKVLLIY